ncbi:MAG: DUF4260 domain-containing protein [Patescibacteria group bacterium]|nr:DUF4260 domain-containing protein [Patescibacteria group bacterium]
MTLILKLEAFVFLVTAIWAYSIIGVSWWLFFILIFTPDLFMIGYFKDSKIGALIYNIGHTYVAPFLLLIIFLVFHIYITLPILIIWIAHISMDRVLGYGLKFDTGFKDTHMGHI